MDFSQIRHPYPSRRSVTYGRRGMVATSQTLAAQAGLAMLKQGGNAADAIIATAIAMTVLISFLALMAADGRPRH